MISYFHVKNFRSIVDAKLDLRYGEGKAPNGYKESQRLPFLKENGCNDRIVPVLALFGANANGKSNILRAMKNLQALVNFPNINVRGLFEPNQIISCPFPTECTLGFIKDSVQFEYQLVYSGEGILSETLLRSGKVIFSINHEKIMLKNVAGKKPYTEKGLEQIFKVECCDGERNWVRPFLNCIGNRYNGLNDAVNSAFTMIIRDIHVLSAKHEMDATLPYAIAQLCNVKGCNQKTALAEIVDVIRKLDVDIKGIDIITEENNLDTSLSIEDVIRGGTEITQLDNVTKRHNRVRIDSLHKNDKNETVVFDFMEQESDGTIRLASLIAFLLCALNNGEPIFVDELDRSLHPLLVREILSIFQRRTRNTKNAQLIFTTHCTDLLDDEILRLSEIGIVSKTKSAGTRVKRLCEFRDEGEDIRNVSNFRRKYLQGFYLGIPYPAV